MASLFNKAANAVDKAVDEAEDNVQGATGIDFGGSGGGKNANDVKDKGEDTSKGVTDSPSKAAKEAAGKAVDKAEDTVQEATGQDLGGSGGGADDSDVDSTESSFDDSGGGGSPQPEKKQEKPEPNTQDKAPQSKKQIKQFLGLAKDKGKKKAREALERIDEKDAKDRDIINRQAFRDGQAGMFETGGEMALSNAYNIENANEDKEFRNLQRSANYFTAESRKQQARNQIEDINQQIQKVRSDDTQTYLVGQGENQKKVSDSELIKRLKQDKESLSKSIENINKNQVSRIENIGKVNDRIAKDREKVTKNEAQNIAKNQDLSKKGFEVSILGQKTGVKLKGGAAEAAMTFDTLTSGGGSSGEAIGAALDQFIPGGKDKTVEQVVETDQVQNTAEVQKNGFNPVEEAGDTLTSVPGIIGTTLAGGAAFSGVSKGLAAVPRVGSAASKTFQAAGAAAGGYTVAKQGGKAFEEARKGRQAAAIGTTTELGAGLAGFYKGQKAFNRYLGARTGTTEINQKNLLRQIRKGEYKGKGRFTAETVVEKPTVRDYVDMAMGKGFRPKTEILKTTGRYGLTASKTGSQAKGSYRTKLPTGETKTGKFEVLSNVRKTGRTRSGKKSRLTSDIARFKTETRLFEKLRDVKELTKSVKQGERRGTAKDVLSNFENVRVGSDAKPRIVETSTTNARSDVLSDTTNFILGKRGGSSSGSSSGGVTQTKSGSGGVGRVSSRVQDIAADKAARYARSQNPSRIRGSGGTSGSDTQANKGGNGQKQGGEAKIVGISSSQLDSFQQKSRANYNIEGVTSQGTRQRQKGRTQQRRKGAGNQQGGKGTTSTAKEIKRNIKKDSGIDTTSYTNIDTSVGQGTRTGTGLGQDRRTGQGEKQGRDVENTQGLGNQLKVTPSEKLKLTSLQSLKTKQKQQLKQLESLKPIETTVTTQTQRPGYAEIDLEFAGRQKGPRPKTSTTKSDVSGANPTLKFDWFSANLAEQEGGEATFRLSESNVASQLREQQELGALSFGLKTKEEKTGEVSKPEIMSDKDLL